MTSSHPTPVPCQWFSDLAAPLDRRSIPRLALLLFGDVLARGRRTVTTWIRAAGLSNRYRFCYIAVAATGKRADRVARCLLTEVVRPLIKGATWTAQTRRGIRNHATRAARTSGERGAANCWARKSVRLCGAG